MPDRGRVEIVTPRQQLLGMWVFGALTLLSLPVAALGLGPYAPFQGCGSGHEVQPSPSLRGGAWRPATDAKRERVATFPWPTMYCDFESAEGKRVTTSTPVGLVVLLPLLPFVLGVATAGANPTRPSTTPGTRSGAAL